MPLASSLVGKQAEKKEYVTNTDSVARKVRLRNTSLTKRTPVAREHRIFVTKMIARHAGACQTFDDVTQTQLVIRRFGAMRGRDWQADRTTIDYWRGAST